MDSSGVINLFAGPIAAAMVGFLASWISSYLSNDRLVKKLEWCTLALSEDSQTKHSEYLLKIRHESEAGLLASHYAPKGRYLACALMSPVLGVFMGLPTDEPQLAQFANSMMFLFISITIVFYGHRAYVKRKALERYFLSPDSASDEPLNFDDDGYHQHLSAKGSIAVLCLVSPTVVIGILTYLIDSGTTPTPGLSTTIVLFLLLIAFTYILVVLPIETPKAIISWSDALLGHSAESKDHTQAGQTEFPNPKV